MSPLKSAGNGISLILQVLFTDITANDVDTGKRNRSPRSFSENLGRDRISSCSAAFESAF